MTSWERLAGERGWRERVVRRWQGENDAMVVRWERWGRGEVARWEVPGFIQELGTQGDS